MHVFEQTNVQLLRYPDGLRRFVFVAGTLQHIAFALPSHTEGLALRERLARFGIVTSDINIIGPIENVLFRDNNGLLLKATWPAEPHPALK